MKPLSEYVRAEIHRFDPTLPIERASMPPSSWYTDPEFLALERATVFQKSWQPVARISELGEPGSYVAGCTAGMPWVVVRDESGSVRAFHNVCRHKGREVVTGSGKSDLLVCGYHAWSYRLDGSLRKAPRIAGIEDFEIDEMGLLPLQSEVFGPFIFVNNDPLTRSVAEIVAELATTLDDGGWRNLRFVEKKEWVIDCNWKVYIDNYLDGGYHIPHMHPTLDAQLDMDTYRTELFERYSIQTSGASSNLDERIDYDPEDRIGDGAIYAWIFPNFMINRYGPCMDTNYVLPLGPDRCRVLYEFYFDETEGDQAKTFIEESIAQADITQQEDIEICESVQMGLCSPAYDRGRYAPRVEVGEHHFHQLLAGAFRSAV